MSSIQSRYVRIPPYSGFCSLVRSRRSSSRLTSVSTPSGIAALATLSRYVETTSLLPSLSCFLNASICRPRMKSRRVFSIPSATSPRVFSFSSAAAKPCAVLAPDHEGCGSGRQVCRLAQASGGTDRAELAVDAGHEQDLAVALAGGLDRGLLVVAVDRKGDRHVREDDDVVHGEDWE